LNRFDERRDMSKCLQIYYNEKRDENIKGMIHELKKAKDSPYYRRRSDSEIALMVLGKALKSEVKKYKSST
jgi:predicted CopG family antitoxin